MGCQGCPGGLSDPGESPGSPEGLCRLLDAGGAESVGAQQFRVNCGEIKGMDEL